MHIYIYTQHAYPHTTEAMCLPDEVDIMAALCEKRKARLIFTSPVAAHKRMRKVERTDWLSVLQSGRWMESV